MLLIEIIKNNILMGVKGVKKNPLFTQHMAYPLYTFITLYISLMCIYIILYLLYPLIISKSTINTGKCKKLMEFLEHNMEFLRLNRGIFFSNASLFLYIDIFIIKQHPKEFFNLRRPVFFLLEFNRHAFSKFLFSHSFVTNFFAPFFIPGVQNF